MLKLFNTLTRKTEEFKPLKKGNVGMYTCGPTVYDFAHIGNFRAYICADILKRYLKLSGFKVKHVMNITDVDDKTIKGSLQRGISLKEYTEQYTKAFFEDLKALSIEPADIFPKATEHINEMVRIIKKLKQKGIAYQADDSSWYYDISKFKDYGKLSHTSFKGLESTERVKKDSYEKENAQDFALWKSCHKDDGNVFWETELGKGRPGWHIECSAMSTKYLGESFDLHTGGVDLIFPHHENEIAQTEGATGKPFVKYWFHNEHLLVDGKKMSKSLENFFTLRDLLKKGNDAKSIRYLLLSVHYRQQLNFTMDSLKSAKNAIEKINNFLFVLENTKREKNNEKVKPLLGKVRGDFSRHMDNDLNISEALSSIFEFMNGINKMDIGKDDAKEIIRQMLEFDNVLGIMEIKKEKMPEDIEKLINERDDARKNKDWKKADEIRAALKQQGIELFDSPEGTLWKKVQR